LFSTKNPSTSLLFLAKYIQTPKNPRIFDCFEQNPNILYKKNTPPQAPDADVDPSALQHDRDDFKTWARGWEEKVYTEESLDPDITLGELLLVYFEWMSVHKACTPHLF
jgi:hypothetical protein